MTITIEHWCEADTKAACCGAALYFCVGAEEQLWICNYEYASRVTFCPFCGYRAEKPATLYPIANMEPTDHQREAALIFNP